MKHFIAHLLLLVSSRWRTTGGASWFARTPIARKKNQQKIEYDQFHQTREHRRRAPRGPGPRRASRAFVAIIPGANIRRRYCIVVLCSTILERSQELTVINEEFSVHSY